MVFVVWGPCRAGTRQEPSSRVRVDRPFQVRSPNASSFARTIPPFFDVQVSEGRGFIATSTFGWSPGWDLVEEKCIWNAETRQGSAGAGSRGNPERREGVAHHPGAFETGSGQLLPSPESHAKPETTRFRSSTLR